MKSHLYRVTSQLLEGLAALFYPEHCVICDKELNQQNNHFCFACRENLHYTYFELYEDDTYADQLFWGRVYIERAYAMLYFEKGNSTQKLLHQIKYSQGRELGKYLGKMMGQKLKASGKFSSITGIVPVPLHSKKEFQRGYNQSLAIVEGVSEELGVPILDILYRRTHDESQTRKSKEERYENVKGKFALKPNVDIHNENLLVVDDVLTTGSTLEFVTKALLNSSHTARVQIATLAIAYS